MSEEDVLKRLAELERKVDHIYAHLAERIPRATAPLPPVPSTGGELSSGVLRLVEEGDLIGAIKQYRAETGAGLAEAKEAVDRAAGR